MNAPHQRRTPSLKAEMGSRRRSFCLKTFAECLPLKKNLEVWHFSRLCWLSSQTNEGGIRYHEMMKRKTNIGGDSHRYSFFMSLSTFFHYPSPWVCSIFNWNMLKKFRLEFPEEIEVLQKNEDFCDSTFYNNCKKRDSEEWISWELNNRSIYTFELSFSLLLCKNDFKFENSRKWIGHLVIVIKIKINMYKEIVILEN